MKPLHETVNAAVDLIIYILTLFVVVGCVLVAFSCTFMLFEIGNTNLRRYYHLDMVTPLFISIIIFIVAICIPKFCKHFIFEKEMGPYYGKNYAKYYHITNCFVLPHAYLAQDDRDSGNYTLNIRLHYRYDEILQAYQEMKDNHRVYHNFAEYNIPGTTCKVEMALSRHTTKRILNEMQADGRIPDEQFVILETAVKGFSLAEIPPKQQFISRDDINILRDYLLRTGAPSVNAAIDIGINIQMDATFLDFCDKLLVSDQELINLPSLKWTRA